ncbi:hypothetical protein ACIRU8_42790 [Streptomyces sp. NPDC101175]|uniref:hypothetical protein n=1 Tax=Streptomyces sp. NPDC101175 TaxID=3366123 RepID=UPI00383662EE
MSLVHAEADLIRLCRRAGLRDGQRVLLEAVLTASDPEAVLTQHATGAPTAVATLARAHSALASRARPGRSEPQPYPAKALGLVIDARKTLQAFESHFPPGRVDGAVNTLTVIEQGGSAGLKNATDPAAQAALLAHRVTEVHTAVTDGFAAAWCGTAEAVTREQLALEMAALCVMEGRQHHLLSDDVRTALSRGSLDAGQLLKILLPAMRDFRVAVVVEGTSRLESLAGLMDSAAAVLKSPGELVAGWGHATADLNELADMAEAASAARRTWSGDQAGGHALLTFTVRARDLGGAALLGRRQASEMLDQYVAGQRVAEIRLRSETLAHDPDSGRVLRAAVPVLGSGPVRPLTIGWPPALRESLRTAHIARVTEAPTTAAGLCWAALEALDVKSGKKTGELARALSLQAARQQVIDLHQRTRTAAAAEVRAARTTHQAAQRAADRLEAAAKAVEGVHAALLGEKAAAARDIELGQRAVLERASEAEAYCAVVEAWTGVGPDGLLRDPDRWLDTFASSANADPVLRAASDGLAALTDRLGGETAARLRVWRALLADPCSLAEWIKETAGRFEKSLNWLYAIRNTALHDGRFASATDLLDVHAGRALVDLTLEFLGNWYQHAPTSEQTEWTAVEVIAHLADRQQKVVEELEGGTRAGWNVSRLTSPSSTGWDRT